MAERQKDRLKRLIGKVIDLKQDKPKYIGGLLGAYKNGRKRVRSLTRPGYVYVRLGGNDSEIIEALNFNVQETWDLKVLVTESDSNPGIYVVVGRDIGQYDSWPTASSALIRHGATHSFGNGSDPVFIYKKQMVQPLQAHPTNPRSNALRVEGDFYIWKNEIKYFPGGNTTDLSVAKPTNSNAARWLTVYLDGDNNALAYQTGTDFTLISYTSMVPTGIVYYIPEVSPSVGIPLSAVYLTTGSSTFGWDDYQDIRNFLDGGGSPALLHELDPLHGYHTGTLRSSIVTVVDVGNYFTGTIVEDVLQELWNAKSAAVHGLDPTHGVHSGTLRSSLVTVADAGNYFTGTLVEGVLQELGLRIGTVTGSSSSGPHNIVSSTHTDSNTGTSISEGDILVYQTGLWTPLAGIEISDDDANILAVNFVLRTGTVASPGSNHRIIYAKSDGIYTKDSSGNEVGPFGTGSSVGGSTDAEDINIVDAGNYYTSTEVEGALQEIGASINDLELESIDGGHVHGVTRLNIVSGTVNVSLIDYAEYIEMVSFNGFVVDPLGYYLSSGSNYLVFNTAVSVGGIVTVNYVILQV
jgi:hypothetical protein